MLSVTATAACSGLRPVAKALGVSAGMTYTAGMGIWALRASRRTTACRRGASASEIGWAPYMASTILSENQ